MNTIRIKDKKKVSRILNKNNYLLVTIGVILILIDIDLFSSQPKFLKTEGFFWKGFAIVFQLTFIYNIIQWNIKKKKIISILTNGNIVEAKSSQSQKIKPNKSYFYIHLLTYNVLGKNYEVSFKNKSSYIKCKSVIYEFNKPENSIAFDDLETGLKKLVKSSISN